MMAVVCHRPSEMTSRSGIFGSVDSGGGAASMRVMGSGGGISQRMKMLRSSTYAGRSLLNEELHVAVGKKVKESKQLVVWALKNNPTVKKVVLVHAHRPSQLIPMMGGRFPIHQLSEQQVRLHRQQEMEKMDSILNEYVLICKSSKVLVEKLVIETNDVVKGLMKAIEENGITKLVMGTSSYSKKAKMPRSKITQAVWKDAPTYCLIWLICRGELINTRGDAGFGSVSSSSSPSTYDDESENDLEILSAHESEHESLQDQDDLRVEEDLYHQVQQAHEEASKFKDVAPDKSLNLRIELLEAKLRAIQMERKYSNVTKMGKQLEEITTREQLKTDQLRSERDEIQNKLELSLQKQSFLEGMIGETECVTKDLKSNLVEAQAIISLLQIQRDRLLQERDHVSQEFNKLQKMDIKTSLNSLPPYTEFSFAELVTVTQNFNSSFQIGQGAYGCVYKAFLRKTDVAIKILNSDSLQGQSEFLQEVIILSRVRHPNLVSLLGACREKLALIYEFLPNGSLEDRLLCRGNTPPLTWQVRTGIMAEICSALIFLHSNKPGPIVHGDLKPANILLDANLVSKLGDFGISRILLHTSAQTTAFLHTNPKGTPAYMDPEFMSTGELTTHSDVYSFGITILRLLTGRSAIGITKEVRDAMHKGNLHQVVDPKAGDWPYKHVQELACLGLKCCEVDCRSRPDLAKDVWKVLEPLKNAASLHSLSSFGSPSNVPSHFLCPVFREIMIDPQVAADGYTYEAEALRGWHEKGNTTSPVTNEKLAHTNLIPNVALRSAIQEWLQQNHH